MANTARTQMALAASSHFVSRVKAAAIKKAWVVIGEGSGVTDHATRANYARLVISNPDTYAAQIAYSIVERASIFAFNTSYDFEIGAVITAAGDPDIEAQIATDWSALSGVSS